MTSTLFNVSRERFITVKGVENLQYKFLGVNWQKLALGTQGPLVDNQQFICSNLKCQSLLSSV